jgi:hypothetical protein
MMETGSEVKATATVLDEVNRETDESWQLEGRLAGGILSGAWRVSNGQAVAVLKWHDPESPVPYNPDAPAVVAYLRANGYPTPAWLASGTTPAGIPWSVQELIPGTSMGQLDFQGAQVIVELVNLHRLLSPPTSFNWSAFMRDQVFGRDSSHEPVKSVGGPLASVLDEALALAAVYETTELPETEMVHCDLSVSNILMHEGRLSGVIDIDATGRGCAAYDALAPAFNDVLYSPRGGPIELLHEFAVDAYGPATVAVAAATLVVEKLDGLVESQPPDLDVKAGKCRSWILAIERFL